MIQAMLKTKDSKAGTFTQSQRETFDKYVSILALGLIAVFVAYVFWQLVNPRKDFYNELWAPAYLLVQGKSPYNTSSLNPSLPAAWFPMAIGFFFPLGWLSENLAMYVWFIFSLIEVCILVYLILGKEKTLFNSLSLGLICFLFPSTVNHFNLGQISLTVTLCLVMAVHFADKNRNWLAAFFMALAFSKPHLALLAGFGLSYYYYLETPKRLFLFWGRTFIMALLLCVPLFIAYPPWIPDAITSMATNPRWTYPSLFSLFQRYLGGWGYIPWGMIVIFVVGHCYFLWKQLPPQNAMYWSIALAPLLTPYIGSWDFVVLLPLLIFTFANADWKRKLFLIFLYGFVWFGMAFLQLQSGSHDFYFWWVPLALIGGIAFVTDWKKISYDNHVV